LYLLATAISVATGCAHKPAYSDLDANRGSVKQGQNQSNANQAAATTASDQPSATSPAQPAESPAAGSSASATPTNTPIKRPTFIDDAKGGIRDLPSYPGAQRVSMQLGPFQGVNTMSLGLRTGDSMDKISAFYEQVIKANKWTVVDKLIDPEMSEWNLKKGEENSAKVQVKKDLKTNVMNIVIVRGEKMDEPTKSAK
jgi:hypothetical protein